MLDSQRKTPVCGSQRPLRVFTPNPSCFILLFILCFFASGRSFLNAQVETVEGPPPRYNWISHGRLEGHLALQYSPAGAFSPDSSLLAAVIEEKVVLMDLRAADIRKALRPHIEGITELQFQSANFVTPSRVFLVGTGLFQTKGKGGGAPTPTLAIQWDVDQDALFGKVNSVGAGGGYGQIRYFPQIGYLGLYKEGNFDLWHPVTGKGGRINIPDLTRRPNLFEPSPDGHWMLLAQMEGSSTADPIVVDLREHKFVDSLRDHHGTVLSMTFSRDGKRVVTACEDGKVRIWSVGDWKLLQTLSGHSGPVHWAEFSADGSWIASAGEDRTARIWSAADGSLVQTLSESSEPLRTIAFSPSGEYLAASGDQIVFVWQRTVGGQ
ncbi:MAG: WD40 repeat domain-containing protein [Terriglobia bacterium]